MAADGGKKKTGLSKEELDVFFNRIDMARAKNEAIVKSWTAKSTRAQEPQKTEEERAAEDAAFMQRINAAAAPPVDSRFLISEEQQNNQSLRAKLIPKKALRARQAREAEEKIAIAKRQSREDSSDDEPGRSALGRAKKRRNATDPSALFMVEERRTEQDATSEGNTTDLPQSHILDSAAKPLPKESIEAQSADDEPDASGIGRPGPWAPDLPMAAENRDTTARERKREKKRQKKKARKGEKHKIPPVA